MLTSWRVPPLPPEGVAASSAGGPCGRTISGELLHRRFAFVTERGKAPGNPRDLSRPNSKAAHARETAGRGSQHRAHAATNVVDRKAGRDCWARPRRRRCRLCHKLWTDTRPPTFAPPSPPLCSMLLEEHSYAARFAVLAAGALLSAAWVHAARRLPPGWPVSTAADGSASR